MSHSDTVCVILAAGKGTRMRSELAKVLHRAGGRAMLEHVIRACQPLKPTQVLTVVGHEAEKVGAVAEAFGSDVVLQKPQRRDGTRGADGAEEDPARREVRNCDAGRCAALANGNAEVTDQRAQTRRSGGDDFKRGAG